MMQGNPVESFKHNTLLIYIFFSTTKSKVICLMVSDLPAHHHVHYFSFVVHNI